MFNILINVGTTLAPAEVCGASVVPVAAIDVAVSCWLSGVCMWVTVSLTERMSVSLTESLVVNLSVRLSVSLSVSLSGVCRWVCRWVCQWVCQWVWRCVCRWVCLSLMVILFMSLAVSIYVSGGETWSLVRVDISDTNYITKTIYHRLPLIKDDNDKMDCIDYH